MSTFIGEYTGKLDDKGRLIMPSAFRTKDLPEGGAFVIHKNVFDNSLEMYPVDEWRKFSEEVLAGINRNSREGNRTWREFNRNRAVVTPDEKTGRITIPKQLLDIINVQKDVMFVGQDIKIELWAKEQWDGAVMGDEELAASFEKLMHKE
jgi:MraZ protein